MRGLDPRIHQVALQPQTLRTTSAVEPGSWIAGSRRFRAGPAM